MRITSTFVGSGTTRRLSISLWMLPRQSQEAEGFVRSPMSCARIATGGTCPLQTLFAAAFRHKTKELSVHSATRICQRPADLSRDHMQLAVAGSGYLGTVI